MWFWAKPYVDCHIESGKWLDGKKLWGQELNSDTIPYCFILCPVVNMTVAIEENMMTNNPLIEMESHGEESYTPNIENRTPLIIQYKGLINDKPLQSSGNISIE